MVFALSSLFIAIQFASAQLSPRIIATTLLRDNTIRLVVALFELTLSFGLGTLARSQTQVQYLLLSCSVVLAGTSTVAFIYLIDYAARLLCPSASCGPCGASLVLATRRRLLRGLSKTFERPKLVQLRTVNLAKQVFQFRGHTVTSGPHLGSNASKLAPSGGDFSAFA